MITNEKLSHVIFLARGIGKQCAWEGVILEELAGLMDSYTHDEVRDLVGLMLIGRNDKRLGISEESRFKNFREYFEDVRKRDFQYEHYTGKAGTILYMLSKASLDSYLYNGHKNLGAAKPSHIDLNKVTTPELVRSVLQSAYEAQISALRNGRTSLFEGDKEPLAKTIEGLTEEEIFEIAGLIVLGGRSYGEATRGFDDVEEMKKHILAHTGRMNPFLSEGMTLRNISLFRFIYNDAPQEFKDIADECNRLCVEAGIGIF